MAAVSWKAIENNENLEVYCLIWLDVSVNSSRENIQAQQRLLKVINHVLTFDDDQQCLHYIKNLSEDDRIILVVSGKFGRSIVPKIANMQQISSIYVYCFDKKGNEQWSQHFPKVKGVVNQLNELFLLVEEDYSLQQLDKIDEQLSIKVFDDRQISSDSAYEQFLHSQLLIDCLIRMSSSSNSKNELIDFCKQYYRKNYTDIMNIKEFENNYSSEKALWWYTKHSFPSRLLNKALRDQNINLLFLFRFFIRDIGCQLGKDKCSSTIRAYRSQLMSREKLEILQRSVGKFISINSFLSANIDQGKTRSSLHLHSSSPEMEKVFFVIEASSNLCNVRPFNNIEPHSYFPKTNQILFMVGSIFRIDRIEYPQDKILNIRISLCSINDQDLKPFSEHMHNALYIGQTSLMQFSNILRRMNKFDEAEKYYRRYLNQLPIGHPDIANCYHAFGKIAESRKNFPSSLKWFKKSLEIYSQISKPDDTFTAEVYNDIATIYLKTNDYTKAIKLYQNALDIWKTSDDNNRPRIVLCLNNIGFVYQMKKKYSEALEYYQQALKISKKIHHEKHPDIAMAYRNRAQIYELIGEYQQALASYEKAIKIYRYSLPATQIHVNEIEKSIRQVSSKLK
ncbi:unnamed protein product [Rotaria socialis]|uniref:Uncharacterized protein n=1 Tax=Rotaria socialis TaxID=392032 RepID=A0A818G9V9_9BILA|nr:unnamed protein product [Rotaria socialis]CAF4810823.1 unnamed protein product [Rotaria socialis]